LIYVLDTNTLSDWIEGHSSVSLRAHQAIRAGDNLVLSSAILYEVRRGLLQKNLIRKLNTLDVSIMPYLDWTSVTDADWLHATTFWVNTRNQGRQLSDVDLLVAAIASRLQATLVTSDTDFDVLPIQKETWR